MATRVRKKPIKKKRVKTSLTKISSAGAARKKTSIKGAAPKPSRLAAKPSTGAVAKARAVKQYEHPTKQRLNNPPVGLVTPETDPDLSPKTYTYDPHLDPQLVWSGKEEKSELTVDTVSLHVHERIDPYTVIDSIRNKESFVEQPSLFSKPTENPPLREALDFYKHQHDWSNRLIAGDSLLVMNSLLEREAMAGQVQMIYVDPPYGIKYGSNFQPFTNRRDVKDGNDDDLTQEPETVRAFRDTWELGIHSYLTSIRDRLLLARDLLTPSGSIFIQISDENVHHLRELSDEVFGAANFMGLIQFVKTSGLAAAKNLASVGDYLVWYAKNRDEVKYRQLYVPRESKGEGLAPYSRVELSDGTRRTLTKEERLGLAPLPQGARRYRYDNLTKPGPGSRYDVHFQGRTFTPGNRWWGTTPQGMENLIAANRIGLSGNTIWIIKFWEDFSLSPITNSWPDTGSSFATDKVYVVQTNTKIVERCVLMTTDPGDLVFDPTCGSGTTAYCSEEWGRRWITCDTSRVAITLAKRRLMTSLFEYYELANEADGVDGGFVYRAVPHVTLKSLANKEPPAQETLYDQPIVNPDKLRVTGPFTVEAVPAPMIAEISGSTGELTADASVVRSGPTQRHADWRSELLKTGARGIGGAVIKFSRVEPLAGTRYLHAEAETAEGTPRRVAISFGPEYQPLEQRQVELAWEEARNLDPRPDIVLFAAFQFDPEAAKDIDEMPAAVTKKTTFLKALMSPDLLTNDLKKKRSSNESFWLVGRPDVELTSKSSGSDEFKFQVIVHGFDYYDIKTGQIESGDAGRIAMWMLDSDYDGRSLFPRQVFFPNAGDKDGWSHLAKALRAELDEELLEAYLGTESLPFGAGPHNRVAIKIIDNRGIESLRVLDLP